MGNDSTLRVRKLCRQICEIARSTAESRDNFVQDGGLIAIGVQPMSKEAEKRFDLETGGKIALHMYPLEEEGHINNRFFVHISDIENQMSESAKNTSTEPNCTSAISGLGVASYYDIYLREEEDIELRLFVFVSGNEVDAKECSLAPSSFIENWAKDYGLRIPRANHILASLAAAG